MPRSSKLSQKCSLLATLAGLTQAELARRLEIKPINLNHFLRGHGDVHSALFIRLLKELGIDIEEIINKELARLSGLRLEEKMTPGAAMETLARAMSREDRQALISYVIKTAQVNLGSKAKSQTQFLRGWIQ